MIQPRKSKTPFDFGQAITMPFQTSGGSQFGLRLLFWVSAIMSLVYLVTFPMILPHYGELLSINQQNMQSIGSGQQPDNSAMMALFSKMVPAYLLMMGGMWFVWVIGETALYRKVLRDEEAPRLPLRIGGDELRVLLSQLGVFAILTLVYFLGLLVVMLVGGVITAAIAPLGILIIVLGVIALMLLLVYLCVALAPAAPLSVFNKKPHVLAANKIVKHRFWQLFGAYIVLFIGGYIGMYLVMYLGVLAVTGNPDFFIAMSGLSKEDPQFLIEAAAQRLQNPIIMAIAVIAQIAYAIAISLWILCLTGVGAYAVKWWDNDDQPRIF